MKNKQFSIVNNKFEYELQKFVFGLLYQQQLREGFDVVIPPIERIAVRPTASISPCSCSCSRS